MNSIIKKQLEMCKVANIPPYNNNTTNITISGARVVEEIDGKTDADDEDLVVGGSYNIKLADYIVKPYDGFNLHKQWNSGIVPDDDEMICRVIDTHGKLVYLSCVGVHTGHEWNGWVPYKSILSHSKTKL